MWSVRQEEACALCALPLPDHCWDGRFCDRAHAGRFDQQRRDRRRDGSTTARPRGGTTAPAPGVGVASTSPDAEELASADHHRPGWTTACWWCGDIYTTTSVSRRYCRPVHANRARQARQRRPRSTGQDPRWRCPVPGEQPYPTLAQAEQVARAFVRVEDLGDGALRGYLCVCGQAHVASAEDLAAAATGGAERPGRAGAGASGHGVDLCLVDVENIAAGLGRGRHRVADVQLFRGVLHAEVGLGLDARVVLATGDPASAEAAAAPWPAAESTSGEGPDGADKALLEYLRAGDVARRHPRIVIVSGDGIFAAHAQRLALRGCRVTVVAVHGGLSRRLVDAAHEVFLLSRPQRHGSWQVLPVDGGLLDRSAPPTGSRPVPTEEEALGG